MRLTLPLVLAVLWSSQLQGHVPEYVSTPTNRVDQYCNLATSCVHDTIAVCGQMGERKRTFLDICDMIEYACDSNEVYIHIDDEKGCPVDTRRP